MMKRIYDVVWLIIFVAIIVFLIDAGGREMFVFLTVQHPIMMGFVKFAVLATMGELLVKRIILRKWVFRGTYWYERSFVWGMLGILFTFVFPIYSAGIDALVLKGMLPVLNSDTGCLISTALWKSTWMNILFAFPMMTFHRITDTLIDKRKLFSRWPFLNVWKGIDWDNMWIVVAPTILWFWIPAHTITFCLPAEFRIIMAAGLSVCLGAILAFAKAKAKRP
jgi:hypothetical protein